MGNFRKATGLEKMQMTLEIDLPSQREYNPDSLCESKLLEMREEIRENSHNLN